MEGNVRGQEDKLQVQQQKGGGWEESLEGKTRNKNEKKENTGGYGKKKSLDDW